MGLPRGARGRHTNTGTFGRSRFSSHSPLPITVSCAAPGHAAFVARGRRPPEPLSVRLAELPNGVSIAFPERTGHLPGLSGRLNPILGSIDRMDLYTANVAIDEGRPQPVDAEAHRTSVDPTSASPRRRAFESEAGPDSGRRSRPRPFQTA